MPSGSMEALLIDAQDYRSFLKRVFEMRDEGRKCPSYASFARKAGLSSRSFPRDVILGRRRLTLSSATSFAKALGLKGDLKTCFLLLVARDEEAARSPGQDARQVRDRLEKTRARIVRKSRGGMAPEAGAFREFKDWFEVYAALGSLEKGASLQETACKTGFDAAKCEAILEMMRERGVCRHDPATGRDIPVTLHPVFEGLGKDRLFENWFLHCLELARASAKGGMTDESRLFLGSVVSVRKERMPEFKAELKDLLARFVDHVEDSEGDRLARFVVAMF